MFRFARTFTSTTLNPKCFAVPLLRCERAAIVPLEPEELVMHTSTPAGTVVIVVVLIVAAAFQEGKATGLALRGLTFEDKQARRIFGTYVEFLATDPDRFKRHVTTIHQLQSSEIHYHLVVGGESKHGIEGKVTSDGRSVFVRLTHVGGPNGEVASMNSRLAHEFEHARQFDSGEIAFCRDPLSGQWMPAIAVYDIGDDVKAWEAQLEASVNPDFFVGARSGTGFTSPSVLRQFADAGSFDERAKVLLANGYKDLRPISNANVRFTPEAQLAAGTVVHSGIRENFFGRVHGARPDQPSVIADDVLVMQPAFAETGTPESSVEH